jgi:2-dehydropantoate 2-reductase
MKIAVIGAGGVGGYFGGRLAAAGEDVTFIAHGETLEALRKTGLTVYSQLGDLALAPVRVEGDPHRMGSVDLVIIAVKLWSTEEALESARPLLAPSTAVVSFQNGVEAVDLASRRLGSSHVMGGVAYIASVVEKPGVIRHNGRLAKLAFGEVDGTASARAASLLEACERARIEAVLSDEIERMIWEKFVFLVALSGMTCVTRRPIGPIREDPVTREMLRDVMSEAASAARAKGVFLAPDIVDRQMRFVDGLPPEMVSSMLDDLERGNRLEVEWLSGAVVRLLGNSKIAAPLNRAIYGALKLSAGGGARRNRAAP